MDTFDRNGNLISHTYRETPSHSESWIAKYDEHGNEISVTFGQDPKHPDSWIATYDEHGNETSRTYGMDPYCDMNVYTVNKLIIGLQK